MENIMNNKIENLTKIMLDYGRTKCVIKSAEEDFSYVQQYLPAVRGYAEHLIKQGYRKERDTARELAKTIKSVVWEEFENETIRIKDLHGVIDDILRSKYGVDLGENNNEA